MNSQSAHSWSGISGIGYCYICEKYSAHSLIQLCWRGGGLLLLPTLVLMVSQSFFSNAEVNIVCYSYLVI